MNVTDKWLNFLDRIEELGDMTIPSLRIYADDKYKTMSRGKLIAEIVEQEFTEKFGQEVIDGSEKG